MSFDTWYIDQFRDTLGEPLSDSDRIPDAEIDAALNGRQIPASMRAYYRVAGKHWLNTNHNQLRSPNALEVVGDYTLFMDENQVVVQWAIRNADLTLDDPVVFQGQPLDNGYEWFAEVWSFSRFMISMWRWVLTGEELE
jgi:hypothetical protein